jgi:MYXO-CTERM domain-containing protein
MSMTLSRIAWSLIPVLALFAASARADVVPPLPDECPPGSTVDYGCGSAFCRAFVCATDADCKGGDCEPVKACFGPNDGLQPPPTEHGGPCLRDDTCNNELLTCQTLGLCLSFGGGTSGDATTAAASTGAASTGVATTGAASTGGSSGISTGVGTTGSAPTGGDLSTSTGAVTGGATGGGGSSETSGSGGGGCSCSLVDGSPGLLGLFGLAALRRRRASASSPIG